MVLMAVCHGPGNIEAIKNNRRINPITWQYNKEAGFIECEWQSGSL